MVSENVQLEMSIGLQVLYFNNNLKHFGKIMKYVT